MSNNEINAIKSVHCFQVFTSALWLKKIYKSLFFTIHAKQNNPKERHRAHTPYADISWCTAVPLHSQCITVKAQKRYMQSKKNKCCTQWSKLRYWSICDKICKRFCSKMNILFLMGYSFPNRTVCVFFFFFFFFCFVGYSLKQCLDSIVKGVKKDRSAFHHRIWKHAKQTTAENSAFFMHMSIAVILYSVLTEFWLWTIS